MASLTGEQLKDTYDSLLKVDDNGPLGGTYKEITDGLGNGSNLYLGTGGNVGIGNSSPARLLTIGDGTGSPNIQLLASTAGGSRIEFGDTDDSDVGEIQYVHGSSNYMQFTTNGTERLRITSSGNVGIGTTSPNAKLDVDGAGIFDGIVIGGQPAVSTTDVDDLRNNGFYGISTSAPNNPATGGAVGIVSAYSSDRVAQLVSAVASDALYYRTGISGSFSAWKKIPYGPSGGGIYLGGTTSANALDDYEEGTFTLTMEPSSGFTATSNTVTARYTKIGNVVTVVAKPEMTIPASLGTYTNNDTGFYILLSGLPFTIASNIQDRSVPSIGIASNIGVTGGYLAGTGTQDSDEITIFVNKDDGSTRTSPNLTVSTTANIHIQFTYRV